MSVKTVSDADTGDSTHVGGADWNKIARWVNGVANVIAPIIDSITTFRSSKLVISGASNTSLTNTFAANPDQTANMTITMPAATSGNIILISRSSSDTLQNKNIPAWLNDIAGVQKFPSVRKIGEIPAGAVTGGGAGIGLLNGFIDMPSVPTRFVDATFGCGWRYNTTTGQNTVAGVRLPARFATKEMLPYLRCKVRCSSTTNTRFYFGWSWQTQIPASDTPIANSESAVLVGWDSNDTNVTIYHNGGTSASTSAPSTAQTTVTKSSMSNQVRQFEILFTAANSCRVRIMDGNDTTQLSSNTITTNLPQDTMSPTCMLTNTSTNAVDFDFFFEELDLKG